MTAPGEPELEDFLRCKCFDASCTDCLKCYLGEFRAKRKKSASMEIKERCLARPNHLKCGYIASLPDWTFSAGYSTLSSFLPEQRVADTNVHNFENKCKQLLGVRVPDPKALWGQGIAYIPADGGVRRGNRIPKGIVGRWQDKIDSPYRAKFP
jgi:hypothetical protein